MKKLFTLALAIALLALACVPALAEDTLGRLLSDFSVETIDGNTFTLSEALADHDMVLINLWATWCPPCEMEFPYLEEAYEQYADRVAVVALSIEPTDTADKLREYADSHGMTFPVGSDSETGLADYFGVASIPTSVVVDRFGNVAFVEAGAQTGTDRFTALFDHFLDEGYTETAVPDSWPAPKPVAGASEAELNAAANAEGGSLEFSNSEDEYTWPMLPYEIDGRNALASTNMGVDNSAAAVRFAVTASEGDALAFDFKTSLEKAYDALYVEIDGKIVKRFTGARDWTAWALSLDAGAHEIALGCVKDSAEGGGEDRVWIDEVRLVQGDEAEALLAALPEYPASGAFSMALAGQGMREIAFDDPAGIIQASFLVDSAWIVDDDAVTARLTLTPNRDPETAFVSTDRGDIYTLAEARLADGGYEIDLPLEAGGSAFIFAYPGAAAGDRDEVQTALAMAGEAGADAFVEYLAQYGYEVGWRYAEGETLAAMVAEGGEVTYTVRVVDQDGNPVPGVYVNFCTDELCELTQSDDGGVIAFTGAPYAYHLQILKVPEDYAFDDTAEVYTEPNGGEMTLEVVRE